MNDYKSRVFAVHMPTGRDRDTGAIKPIMDLTPALEYGELRFILRDWQNPFKDTQSTADEIARVLLEERVTDRDWLLLVGNPCLIGLVAAQTALITGQLNLLQWDRNEKRYTPVSAQLYEGDGDAEPR